MQARRAPARESYPPRPRREDRRSAQGSAAGALRSPRRRLQVVSCLSRGACSIGPPKRGRRKPKEGGVGRGGVGTIRSPGTWRGSREGRSAARRPGARQPVRCPQRQGPNSRRLRPAPPEPGVSSSRSAAGARWAVATAAPKFAQEGAMRRGWLWGSQSPERRGWSVAEPLPFAGQTPASRAPSRGVRDRKITSKRRPGESGGWLQDRV